MDSYRYESSNASLPAWLIQALGLAPRVHKRLRVVVRPGTRPDQRPARFRLTDARCLSLAGLSLAVCVRAEQP